MPFPGGQEQPSAPRVEWVESPERFAEIGPAWTDLAGTQGTPFAGHEWFQSWWRAFGKGRMRTLLLWEGDALVAAMPMERSRGVLAAMANHHSPHYAPLSRDRESLSRLLGELFADPTGTLLAPGLPAETDRTRALLDAARDSGRMILTDPGQVSPIVETDGDFSAWRAVSKRRWRTPIERFRRKMLREHEAHIEVLQAPAELDRRFEQGIELEASGWKGEAGTAIASSPDTSSFYRAVAAAFASRGELSLSSIVLDGRMVAFDLSLLHQGRLYLLKTAYDEGFGRLAPGLVLRLSVIERCFELGLAAHELLGGADEYKLKFSTTERRHVGLRAYRRLPGPVVRYGYRRAIRPRLREAYRAVRDRAGESPAKPAG